MKKHLQKAAAILLSVSMIIGMIGCQAKQDSGAKDGNQETQNTSSDAGDQNTEGQSPENQSGERCV